MSALASYRSASLAEVKKLIENGPKLLDDLSSSMATNFKYAGVSEAEAAFLAALSGGDVEKANDAVDACYTATRDALSTGAQSIRVLERFIGLHVPQMGESLKDPSDMLARPAVSYANLEHPLPIVFL